MPIVQELSRKQMREALTEAVAREVPVSLSSRIDGQWLTLHTQVLRCDSQGLVLACPPSPPDPAASPTGAGEASPALAEAAEVCLSFKIKHYKHVANTTIEAHCRIESSDGQSVACLRVCPPQRMQRIQRRAYQRVDVPRSRSILATFWHGESSAGEAPPARPALSWEGWVENISAGGFQTRLAGHGAPPMEEGEIVAVQIQLGQEFRPVTADARFRHQVGDQRGVVHQGFQFVGLNETDQGREIIRRIGQIVCEFQRHAPDRADHVA